VLAIPKGNFANCLDFFPLYRKPLDLPRKF
jgi:hypothetical protein